MNNGKYQSGMSVPGILAILVMLGFFVLCIIRMSPPYFESLTVRSIVESIVGDPEMENLSTSQIRRKLDTEFNTNQILELQGKEVEIYRRKGKTYIDANYEVRMPIFWRIDAVLKFDDLHYELGKIEPVSRTTPRK